MTGSESVVIKIPKLLFRALLVLIVSSGFALLPAPPGAGAHGGGLDGNGGHNCRVGSCAGTYHCHRCPCGCTRTTNPPSNTARPQVSRPKVTLARCVRTAGVTTFTKNEIALLQAMLKFLGFNPGPVDGIYGSRTRAALNSFEGRFGLSKSSSSSIYYQSIARLLISC